MRGEFLPFSPPLIGEEEIAEVIDALRSGWITTGPRVERFEREFAAFIGAPAALALNSGTAALHVALAALGIGPGDAVITTPMTFCSCVHVIEQVGARAILVDVEPATLNIDPLRVREAIRREAETARAASASPRIRAIMPVHLYGHPCDLDALSELAREHKVAVVEDAAHALPARYRGRLIGSFSSEGVPVLTCFSFYATKNLTTGEGGMLTGPAGLLDEASVWSLHGMSHDAFKRYQADGSWRYDVLCAGFKYNMTDLQAAIGLHQLRRLAGFRARRREIALRYTEAFSQLEELETPVEHSNVEHAWHLYVIRLNPERFHWMSKGHEPSRVRDRFIQELRARRIGTSVHFIPVHLHHYYRSKYGYRPEDFPVAYREFQRIVSLPLYPKMSDQDVEDVIEAVCDVVRKYKA